MLAQTPASLLSNRSFSPIDLYSSQQVYAMEQAWFDKGYSSFGLMQQAAWQIAQHIIQLIEQNSSVSSAIFGKTDWHKDKWRVCVWVGCGNNGGDGWLVAYYLQQAGWQVQVITVGTDNLEQGTKEDDKAKNLTDAVQAQNIALAAGVPYQYFIDDGNDSHNDQNEFIKAFSAEVHIDALFGIGLNRAPTGIYKKAILAFNNFAQRANALTIAIDIPSGIQASTGQVFERLAIKADITLCLIARKFGLHTKDGTDYAGRIIDIPLIPFEPILPTATLLSSPQNLLARRNNSYKGSYGHVLIIGGNRIDGSQGMGGAAILASASAMATGAGKITVACHKAFHGALLTSLPDAMTINLKDKKGVKDLIKDASVIAIGMGLGRDDKAKALFVSYLQAIMVQGHAIVIDADGLYHLASLHAEKHKVVSKLKDYSKANDVYLTPHSGEAARLLGKKVIEIESDRLTAIKQCADIYGGNWVLKGSGSLVLEQLPNKPAQVYVCAVGNAGMATAGMGDVLAGISAGLLAQQDLNNEQRSLQQAVLIHGLAADWLTNQAPSQMATMSTAIYRSDRQPLIGQRGLQAQDMPAAIRQVMESITAN